MNEKEQYLAAVLWDLHQTKEMNRELLRENTNLKIENAKMKVRLEWYQAFADRRKRGNRNDNQC